jgi:hypothetical protein
MNRYVFYNSTDGDIYWVKTVTQGKADRLCAVNVGKNMAYVLESDLNKPVTSHITQELDLSTTPFSVVNSNNKGVETASEYARKTRNSLLTECDWTQGADSPLSDSKKAEWATYRQALRDFDYSSLTTNVGILWPTKPS